MDTNAPSSLEPETLDSPIEELSPAERNLMSLHDKLKDQIQDLGVQLEKGTNILSGLRSRIKELETSVVPGFESTMRGASNDVAETKGALTGLVRARKLLRDETSETSIVRSLKAGVDEHEGRARTFAVELMGEHADLIEAFLRNPVLSQYRRLHSINEHGTDVVYGPKREIVDDQGRGIDEAGQDVVFIDESRATGLPFEIKSKLRPAVSSALAGLTKAIIDHGYASSGYTQAEESYQYVKDELRQAILRKHGFLAEISREVRLAEGLRDSIQRINLAAAHVEREMEDLATDNITKAEVEFAKIKIDYKAADDELRRKREEVPGWKLAIDAWKRSKEKTHELLSQMSDVAKTLERGDELLANVNKLQGELSAVERGMHNQRAEAQSSSVVRGMFTVDESIQADIDEAVGMWKGVAMSARDNLERAFARLKYLYEKLTSAIEDADSAETHRQLNTEVCERVIEAGRILQRFLDDEWTQLDAGSEDKIAAIREKARADLEAVLRPQMALKMLGEILEAAQDASGAPHIIGQGFPAIGPEAWAIFRNAMAKAEMHPEAPIAAAEPTKQPEQTPPAAEETTAASAEDAASESAEAGRAQSADVLKEVLAGAAAQVATPPAMAAEEQQKEPAEAAADAEAADLTSEPTRIGVAPITSPQASQPSPRRKRGVVEE